MAAWRLRSLKCWDDQATNCMEKAEGTQRRLEMSASLAVYQLLSCWVCRVGGRAVSSGCQKRWQEASPVCVGHEAVTKMSMPVRDSAVSSLCVYGTKAHTADDLLTGQQAILFSQHVGVQCIMPGRRREADTQYVPLPGAHSCLCAPCKAQSRQ